MSIKCKEKAEQSFCLQKGHFDPERGPCSALKGQNRVSKGIKAHFDWEQSQCNV